MLCGDGLLQAIFFFLRKEEFLASAFIDATQFFIDLRIDGIELALRFDQVLVVKTEGQMRSADTARVFRLPLSTQLLESNHFSI